MVIKLDGAPGYFSGVIIVCSGIYDINKYYIDLKHAVHIPHLCAACNIYYQEKGYIREDMDEDKKLKKKIRLFVKKFVDETTEKRGESENRKWVSLSVADDEGTLKVNMDDDEMKNLIRKVEEELSVSPYEEQKEEYLQIITEKLLKEVSKQEGTIKAAF